MPALNLHLNPGGWNPTAAHSLIDTRQHQPFHPRQSTAPGTKHSDNKHDARNFATNCASPAKTTPCGKNSNCETFVKTHPHTCEKCTKENKALRKSTIPSTKMSALALGKVLDVDAYDARNNFESKDAQPTLVMRKTAHDHSHEPQIRNSFSNNGEKAQRDLQHNQWIWQANTCILERTTCCLFLGKLHFPLQTGWTAIDNSEENYFATTTDKITRTHRMQGLLRIQNGASHDSPRTPNVHISGPWRFKHHQNSTKGPPREGEKNENCGGRGKKSAKFGAPTLRDLHPSGPQNSKLAEVELAKSNWPKYWPKSNRWCLPCFFFFSFFSFCFFFFFLFSLSFPFAFSFFFFLFSFFFFLVSCVLCLVSCVLCLVSCVLCPCVLCLVSCFFPFSFFSFPSSFSFPFSFSSYFSFSFCSVSVFVPKI